jgi:polyhydroxyalkanoate synthesis regulator phasin
MLLEAVRRIEQRLNDAEQASAKVALRSELSDLKARVHALEARIADLEAEV